MDLRLHPCSVTPPEGPEKCGPHRPTRNGYSCNNAPNQRWVGDTTECVIATSGKLSLAVILDLFSRFVVGWALSAVNDRHLTIKALEMALKRRCPDFGLLHHSDQGCTYASGDYQDLLDARGIVCSMSRRGNGYDCEHDGVAA